MQSQNIYAGPGSGIFYSPFNLKVTPMKRLLLINWAKHAQYEGIELQFFDDAVHGRGLIVLVYRLDRKVDVYFEPSVTLDKTMFGVGAGLGEWVQTAFEANKFEIGSQGAQVDVTFTDYQGQRITAYICEKNPKPPLLTPLLAPLGDGIAHPLFLPLFFLDKFAFIRQKGTEIKTTVGGSPAEPARFPFPIDMSRIYFSRYSGDPLIVTWNEAFAGTLPALRPTTTEHFKDGDVEYDLVEKDGHFEIAAMGLTEGSRSATITFNPAFPDAAGLCDGAMVAGTFTAASTFATGTITGDYEITRQRDEVKIRIHPSGGWHLSYKYSPMMALVLRLIPVFKKWPKTYEWNAVLTLGDSVSLHSEWHRIAAP